MTFLRHALCALALCCTASPSLAVVVAAPAEIVVPPGFERQALEPIGGAVARPAGWLVDTQETPSGWSWVIAEQDPREGKPYLTGLRLQLAMGIEDNSGLTRAAFVAGFAEQKKREALEVYRDCPVDTVGDFYRRCFEVRERIDMGGIVQEFRVRYSLMWGRELDWVVTSVFGTPVGNWPRVQAIADAMAPFRLFDGDLDKLVRHAGHVRTIVGPAKEPAGPIFNPVDEGIADADPDGPVKDAVGREFVYRDIVRGTASFVSAKPLAGGLPPVAYAPDGTRLYGSARIAYVVTAEGRAAAVRVLETSEPRLVPTLLAAARAWRFEPGTFEGKPVDVLAVQEFDFVPDADPDADADADAEAEAEAEAEAGAEAGAGPAADE